MTRTYLILSYDNQEFHYYTNGHWCDEACLHHPLLKLKNKTFKQVITWLEKNGFIIQECSPCSISYALGSCDFVYFLGFDKYGLETISEFVEYDIIHTDLNYRFESGNIAGNLDQ